MFDSTGVIFIILLTFYKRANPQGLFFLASQRMTCLLTIAIV